MHIKSLPFQADKLFVGNSFVRNLSADEQKKIGNFIEHSKKYVEDQMRTLNEVILIILIAF